MSKQSSAAAPPKPEDSTRAPASSTNQPSGDAADGKRHQKGKGGDSTKHGQGKEGGKTWGKPTQYDDPKQRQKAQKKQILALEPSSKQVPLFSHLPQFERPTTSVTERIMASAQATAAGSSIQIHPKILRLGLQYASRQIQGSNARTMAMLKAFRHFVKDYETPPAKTLAMDLDNKLKPHIQFLIDCRPMAVGMGNAIKHFRRLIGVTTQFTSEEKAKEYLIEEIDKYIYERIVVADKAIMEYTTQQIQDGDVILTYASSYIVEQSLKHAHSMKKNFQVIVVDSRPRFEGKTLLTRLQQAGIKCTYVMLNAVSYIMKDVNKVLLGAHAMLTNGQVYSRVGTAVVSAMANSYNVPVIICCETYKFAERVQLDAICQNELDDPDGLLKADGSTEGHALADWKNNPCLKLLNLVYDLTPMEFVSMVITEHGIIPPTSVPVIIREYHQARAPEQLQQEYL